MEIPSDSLDEIFYIGFNQDASCFIVGTNVGFRIFTTLPLKYAFRRDLTGGVGVCELFYRSNIIALTGGGQSPCIAPNKVLIWDDRLTRPCGEVSLRYEVRGIRLHREYLIIIVESKIYVYALNSLKFVEAIPTASNSKGLCVISNDPHPLTIACPEKAKGCVLIKTNNLENSKLIMAHKASISSIAMNSIASFIATASDKGTIIRIFSVESGFVLQELRRGIDRAEIYSLCFHPNSEWIAVTSNKGTLHIFSIGSKKEREIPSAKQVVGKVFPKYANKQRSFAHIKVNGVRTVCSFTSNGEFIIIISADGEYYLVKYDYHRIDSCELVSQEQISHLFLS